MSITDELREYIGLGDGTVQCAIRAIADRIDERYHRDMATAQQVGINEGEDAAMRDGWVELPKDADGVPIHVGDELCGYGRPNGGVFCKAVNEHMVLVGEKDDGYKMWLLWDGSECRHHHEPTVEDVLREFFSRYVTTKPKDEDDAIIAEYAAKLRLAGEDE